MNKSLRILTVPAALLLAFSLFSGCSKKKNTEHIKQEEVKKEIHISLGFSTNMEDPRGVASKLFKDEVEKNSQNRIIIDIYPNGLAGSDTELIEGLMKGTVDMTVSSAGNFAVYATKMGISALPFLFSNFEEAWEFLESDLVQQVNKDLNEFNIQVLSNYDNGFRCVTTTNRPVKNVKDMEGLKIRTPPNQIVMETMSALGASPKPYAFTELKKALKDGIFDSQENPIPVIYNSKLYEEQKYLSITNHSYDAMPLVIRKDLWDSFSESDKNLILDAAKKAQDLNRKLVKEQTENYVEKLKEAGMIITNPDLSEFSKKSSSVINVFSPIYGNNLVEKIKAL